MKTLGLLSTILLYAGILFGQSCTTFENTSFRLTILPSQVDYGAPIYEHNNLTFRMKYNEVIEGSSDGVSIGDAVETGYHSYNTNYSGNIMYQGNAITQIDFNQAESSNIVVEFDVIYELEPVVANPFYINEADQSILPDSTTWTLDSLTNGYHVTISGAVHTIAFEGWEVAFDNICVQDMNSSVAWNESASSSVTVFPNPTQGLLTVTTDVNLNRIELYDLAIGRLVFSTQSNLNVIDISAFNNGVYCLICYSDKDIFTSRVLKLEK